MPSKSTFALVALLAATSVSALPTRGSWVDLVERGPDTPVAVPAAAGAPPANTPPAVVPPAAVLAQTPGTPGASTPIAGSNVPHHRQHHQHPHRRLSQHSSDDTPSVHGHGHGHGHGHSARRQSLSSDGTTTPHHKHHHHRQSSTGSAVTPPVKAAAGSVTPPAPAPAAGATVPGTPPTAASTTLTRREFYEALYPRNPDHPHHHHHHPHHHHHSQNQQQQQAPAPPQDDGNAAPPAPLQSRELLERRGLLETLGLKARVSNLTVKQTDQMTKAKTICGGLASKKDQHKCHKTADKIIQLTKERNYDVEQFIKLTNHHDVFTSSDPSLKSSSTSSSSSSSHF